MVFGACSTNGVLRQLPTRRDHMHMICQYYYHHQSAASAGFFVRYFSSRNQQRSRGDFQLDALPFSVTPSEAYAKFQKWANDEQGLGHFLTYTGSANITAAYAPFWYFDLNVRFIIDPSRRSTGRSSRGGIYLATPEPFKSAYPNAPNGVIHIPGLAAYAGFSYRRSLIDPVHNTTPVFMKKEIVPFGQWMLEPLKYNNQQLEIYPDPWNATRERAYSVVYDELQSMANEQYQKSGSSQSSNPQGDASDEVIVETERVSARRIYMPTYIVEYTILGITYRACISGCDPSIQVSGVSHKTIFSSGSKEGAGAMSMLSKLPQGVASTAAGAFQIFGPRPFFALAQVAFAIVSRIAMRFHIVGILGGVFVAWKKLFRPYIDERSADADWERQRANESQKSTIREDSFRDTGSAKAYFIRNETVILRRLSDVEGRQHDESYEWYNQWEAWAREQWEKAQREASRAQEEWQRQQQQQQQGRSWNQYQQSTQQQQQKQQRQYKQAKKDDDFKWDFDVNDPWSVLGIPRNSSKEEVSKAFRRVSFTFHPRRFLLENSMHTLSHHCCSLLCRKC